MMPTYCLFITYAILLVAIPVIAQCPCFRNQFLPRLSHFVRLDLVGRDELIVCIGFMTLYTYFIMGILVEFFHTKPNIAYCTVKKTTTTSTTPVTRRSSTGARTKTAEVEVDVDEHTQATKHTIRFERAHQQLRQLFPAFGTLTKYNLASAAFVTSALLMWANTNKFDTYRHGFLFLQGLILFLLPFACACPKRMLGVTAKIAYRCALYWTLAYAMMPGETNAVLCRISHFFGHRSDCSLMGKEWAL
ncbi:uncharacterized protein BYT42DRAFT_550386 [Radiomyces spectabilis]|uniref:uncharacterized protein n=1 Tax=Radiomyces spectabilis TaxID=64574 RepID=UPI0022211524|nr:uncharacterized protein BYT42DRAFT_550386 [Radiomyces spectabilis]KAI8364782.1 hypothetical protein BYT42DRAFT_550386 [Radiomyces spectabilis]